MPNKLIYFLSQSHIRSSIAEAWAKKLQLSGVTFISGSWLKARETHFVSDALHEFAIEPPNSLSHVPSQKLLDKADLIVTIYDSAYELAPRFPNSLDYKVIYWDIKDPEHASELGTKWAVYQEACDQIALAVKQLKKTFYRSLIYTLRTRSERFLSWREKQWKAIKILKKAKEQHF
ncbi:arsenate reductase [Listeria floridensis FSL S10-1187]|uniref:Arsenate reductase n=1 Tax=Listeria floridensis FSL S10-1187 TaxID=1265817 RepID=A0ABP3B342_9LIST|nr:arsenate reductase [Listeria floridensis FSL S10-1187]